MGEKELKPLPLTKAKSAEERLEELINHNSIIKCIFLPGAGFWADVGNSEFRKYPEGFEVLAKNTPKTITTKGLLYVERRSVCFLYNLGVEKKKQDVQKGE